MTIMQQKATLLNELDAHAAQFEFLKSENYCTIPLPKAEAAYIDFSTLLEKLYKYFDLESNDPIAQGHPENETSVNYIFYINKDGKFSWRPLEIIHPVIYVQLVRLITTPEHWNTIQYSFEKQSQSWVHRCSGPYRREEQQTQTATEILNWWNTIEQQSLSLSLNFSNLTHTDITNFYASIYTHTISWAIHGKTEAKARRSDDTLLGNKIDKLIRAGRNDETMGISQGSMLMDFIAELILAYADDELTQLLEKRGIKKEDFHIIRYRDDYRIFTNDTTTSEKILKSITDTLQTLRLSLGSSKTVQSLDVITAAIKPDKLSAISLNDLGDTNAKTLQKQLLRIYEFSKKHLNCNRTGVLLEILSEKSIEHPSKGKINPLLHFNSDMDRKVCLAIITEIIFHSPRIFTAAARLISIILETEWTESTEKQKWWTDFQKKINKLSHTEMIDLWMQRLYLPKSNGLTYSTSSTKFCEIISNHIRYFDTQYPKKFRFDSLWNNNWIPEIEPGNSKIKNILKQTSLLSQDPRNLPSILKKEEVNLLEYEEETHSI